jgi:hypothetical protein
VFLVVHANRQPDAIGRGQGQRTRSLGARRVRQAALTSCASVPRSATLAAIVAGSVLCCTRSLSRHLASHREQGKREKTRPRAQEESMWRRTIWRMPPWR